MSIKVVASDGTEEWYRNGSRHRIDGPAYISPNGYKAWWQNDSRHRRDGPAIIHHNGRCEWWVYNEIVRSPEEFQKLTECSDEELIMLLLKYGDIS